jgi:predicted HNH restriction endonuclease
MAEVENTQISLTPEEEWKAKEEAYQAQIANLRKLNEKLLNYSEDKQRTYEHNVQKLQNERDIIQKRLEKMELDELKEAASGSGRNMEAFKEKYDKGEIQISSIPTDAC